MLIWDNVAVTSEPRPDAHRSGRADAVLRLCIAIVHMGAFLDQVGELAYSVLMLVLPAPDGA